MQFNTAAHILLVLYLGFITGAAEFVRPHCVMKVMHHDKSDFTQGLLINDGKLVEGTGLNGHSKLKVVNLETGAVLQQVDLSRQYFGEGVTRHGDHYFQLTWQSGKVFVYSVADLKLVRTGTLATTTGQGWGITSDGVHLIVSDGSSHIMFVDPESLEVVRRVTVHHSAVSQRRHTDSEVSRVNELEYIDGFIWANVWFNSNLFIIQPSNGEIVGNINLHGLRPASTKGDTDAVLNGIAWDAVSKRLFVTGKRWPVMYELAVDGLTHDFSQVARDDICLAHNASRRHGN